MLRPCLTLDPLHIGSEQAYRRSIDRLLAATSLVVCVFDRDLINLQLEYPARCEVLTRLLAARADARLRLVLHDPLPLEKCMPRMLNLLRRHSATTEVRQTPQQLRGLADCFLLGDAKHGVVRFHALQARGKCFFDDVETANLWQTRFNELWEVALPCRLATRLGL